MSVISACLLFISHDNNNQTQTTPQINDLLENNILNIKDRLEGLKLNIQAFFMLIFMAHRKKNLWRVKKRHPSNGKARVQNLDLLHLLSYLWAT